MTSDPRAPHCDGDSLWALATGVLEPEPEAERSAREAHLAACAPCQARLSAIRADVEALGYLGQGAQSPDALGSEALGPDALGSEALGPEALARAVLQRSRQVQARARRLRWGALALLALAAVIGGAAVAHRLTEMALVRRDLWNLDHALQRIQNREGSYPADEAALGAALLRLGDPGLRLDAEGRPLDRWAQPFRYRYPGQEVPGLFDLWSIGPNGVDEGGGPDDQSNWAR